MSYLRNVFQNRATWYYKQAAFSRGIALLGGGIAAIDSDRVRKISPKFSCIKFSESGTSRPKSRDIPATTCLKQQKKTTCIKFLSGISRRLGPGCPRNIPPKNFMFRLFFGPIDSDEIESRKTAQWNGPLRTEVDVSAGCIDHY